jgi:uncharacterized protein YjgD (DUF1641 family)
MARGIEEIIDQEAKLRTDNIKDTIKKYSVELAKRIKEPPYDENVERVIEGYMWMVLVTATLDLAKGIEAVQNAKEA